MTDDIKALKKQIDDNLGCILDLEVKLNGNSYNLPSKSSVQQAMVMAILLQAKGCVLIAERLETIISQGTEQKGLKK